MSYRGGRHFLQIPGPTNIPERVLRAMAAPTIDHRGPDFSRFARELLKELKDIFKTTEGRIVVYPSSGTGAWEAALVNTLSPGDSVLMVETGQFATLWSELAARMGLDVQFVPGDWRHGVDPAQVERILTDDSAHKIKAVGVVHNETSTGITSRIAEIRNAMDRAGHPALFLVDVISSLASIDYHHDQWGVDVTIAGSQKGLMLPPGMSFHAVSAKAIAASKTARLPRAYWEWQPMFAQNEKGLFPFTPATNLLYGLRESLAMIREEGLENIFARHARHAEATRRAVRAWGLELLCQNAAEYSSVVTAVLVPAGHSADAFRQQVLENFNMSLGNGLGRVQDKVFRIGHLGDFNDLMLAGTLCGVEMGLELAGILHSKGGVAAAMDYLTVAARQGSESHALAAR
ncbi:MAG: aminotransferase class V-fold PLP-dependent enzyme [Bryobacterales bacterium]|nr:aminotransferase class V-fold PLP-dependent enzyme [Bryobacterales bacterium]MBV9399269.1 aminotransferase class V-fold PLP-dependent enzyme [Bryobacterales bacterium]